MEVVSDLKIIQGVYGQLNLDKASSKLKTGRMFEET